MGTIECNKIGCRDWAVEGSDWCEKHQYMKEKLEAEEIQEAPDFSGATPGDR